MQSNFEILEKSLAYTLIDTQYQGVFYGGYLSNIV